MKFRSSIPYLLLLIISLSSCSNFKYKSVIEFRNAKEEEQIKLIQNTLDAHNLKSSLNFLKFVNLVFDNSNFYNALNKVIPQSNFAKSFDETIQTLYFSYSPENYKAADKHWQEVARKYLAYACEYHYRYNEDKFRSYLLNNFDPENAFIFYDGWFSKDYTTEQNIFILSETLNHKAWDAKYNYKDFKYLQPEEQASLIYRFLRAYWIRSGHEYNNTVDKINDVIAQQWLDKSEYYLTKSTVLTKLGDQTPIKIVLDRITNETLWGLRKTKH